MRGWILALVVWLSVPCSGQMDSVVQVLSPEGRGTGWVAYKHSDRDEKTYWGIVVTARHCVQSQWGGLAVLTCKFGSGFTSEHCTVAAYDSDDDIAAIWCIVPIEVQPLKLAAGCSKTLRNLGLAIAGEDPGVVDIADEHAVYWHGVVTPGDSGGPAVNDKGEVVCVVTNKTWDDFSMTTYRGGGVALNPIRELLGVCVKLKLPGAV